MNELEAKYIKDTEFTRKAYNFFMQQLDLLYIKQIQHHLSDYITKFTIQNLEFHSVINIKIKSSLTPVDFYLLPI